MRPLTLYILMMVHTGLNTLLIATIYHCGYNYLEKGKDPLTLKLRGSHNLN